MFLDTLLPNLINLLSTTVATIGIGVVYLTIVLIIVTIIYLINKNNE